MGSALGQRSSLLGMFEDPTGEGAPNPAGMWAGPDPIEEGGHPSPLQAAADSCHAPQDISGTPPTRRPPRSCSSQEHLLRTSRQPPSA
ncbi:hypothetical protein I79_009222 [Cricetulus griseus]|nr:hypothetical protein I79_009222 [Cricetulus griseus]